MDTAWVEVASVVPGRNNEQCRDRWTERLNPKVPRGKWTAEEDRRLTSAVDELGVGRWKEVSERVGTGRTDNTCRYRYDFLKGPNSSDTFPRSERGTSYVLVHLPNRSDAPARERNAIFHPSQMTMLPPLKLKMRRRSRRHRCRETIRCRRGKGTLLYPIQRSPREDPRPQPARTPKGFPAPGPVPDR
ncbi:Homeodomain-like protein [Lactarius deliciosus]|nr:Homeodomain-like protein [Lactarius deliciosus]